LLNAVLGYKTGEMLERSVITAFGFGREKTGRELPASQVIGQAFATNPFSGARFISTVAILFVFHLFTIHKITPLTKD
jgi:hypothetical protein